MDTEIIKQVLDELFSSFEDMETRSAAIVLLLKDQGTVTEEALSPYLEQAGKTSNVRWRAARVRIGALLESAMKAPEQKPQSKPGKEETAVRKEEDEANKALSKPDVEAKNQKGTDGKTERNGKKTAESK